jgi:hypothetical protein
VIKSILPATILSSLVISAAWGLPIPRTPEVNQASATNLTQVGEKKYYKKEKNYYKAEKKHYQKYHHGGKYWGHRYSYRPPGWQVLGCVAAGPVWYCP